MWADYSISGTSSSFRLEASNKRNQSNLRCLLSDMSTLCDDEKSVINIGSRGAPYTYHKEYCGTVFIMAGIDKTFVSSSTSYIGPWMSQSMGYLADRNLRQICIPGTHNSGISRLTHQTSIFATPSRVVNQYVPIKDQLRFGVRYFDIRPLKRDSDFWAGHVSKLGPWVGYQGGSGQSIDEIIDQINDFTNENHELIIVNISHDFNAETKYSGLSDSDWNELLSKLDRLKHLFFADGTADLSKMPLKTFIGKNEAAVILRIQGGGGELERRIGKGFFWAKSLPIYDQYAKSSKPEVVMEDQFRKLKEKRGSPDDEMFSLGWTMTMEGAIGDLLQWADERMNPRLPTILPETSKTVYPNIISVDGLRSTAVVAMATAINARAVYG